MDGVGRSRAREEYGNGGYVMDFSMAFHRSKRPRSDDGPEAAASTAQRERNGDALASVEEKQDTDADGDCYSGRNHSNLDSISQLMKMTAVAATAESLSSWRLPANHSLEANQQYLNEQLEHVAALSTVSWSSGGSGGGGKVNGTRMMLSRQANDQDDVDSVCKLDLEKVWRLIPTQTEGQASEKQDTADKGIRGVMDLVSYLLYVRNHELEHQNQLSETLRGLEKQLERKTHIIQSMTTELETVKQNSAQQQNIFKAKEQALKVERKSLQSDKKCLEVNCARLQGLETSYKAQLRRKDVDYARLRKTLQDSVARAAKEKRGIAVAKTLNGVKERKQAAALYQSKETKLTKQIMENLERKKGELLFENEALAKSYDSLQRQLESLTSQYKKAVQLFLAQKNLGGDASELEKLASAPIDDFTPTPFNMATKQGIPQYITESMEALNGKLRQLEQVIRNEIPVTADRNDKEVIEILRHKLDEAHLIISEQDHLLQASLSSPAKDVRMTGGMSHRNAAPETRAESNECSPQTSSFEYTEFERRELALLRSNLENERRLLQEQAMKLDKDRLEFEIAKQDEMFGSPKDALPFDTRARSSSSGNDGAASSTPKRKVKGKRLDMDGLDAPFEIPVSATPATAALLKKIGIIAPTGNTSAD